MAENESNTPRDERMGLQSPATWTALYVVGALVALVGIRKGFRPVIPS